LFTLSHLHELWSYRDLLIRLAWSDFKLRYKSSALGFFWSLLEPLLMLVVLYVVFSNLMRVQVEHYQLFLLLGIILWNFIDRGTSMSIWGIVGKASLVQKVYRRCFVSFDHDAKVENTVDQDQIGLVSNQIHPDFLVVSESDGDNLPSVKGGQRDLLKSLPRKDALVIDNRAVKPKLWFVRLVSLVGFADLGNGSNRKLGGKTKLVSDRVVNVLWISILLAVCIAKTVFAMWLQASLINLFIVS